MATTPILIRAAARGGKFLGPDAGGANFWVYNATTGDTYASRLTITGDSGPGAMMTTPMRRDTPLPVDDATARLFVQPDLDRPCLLYVGIEGPLLYPDQASFVTVHTWVLPGLGTGDPTAGNAGLVIDIPGICIAVKSYNYDETTRAFTVSAAVMMMCGCKVGAVIGTTSPWPPTDFDVKLVVGLSDSERQAFPILYSGKPSIYDITQILPAAPVWAMITASQISMGQSGVCTVFGDAPRVVKTLPVLPVWIERV